MSSAPPLPPEFFLDRSIGRLTADDLRTAGWTAHTVYEEFANQGQGVPDEDWIEYGCSRSWICLTKDKRIRYQAHEIGALRTGHVFCLADDNLPRAEATRRLLDALPAMTRGLLGTAWGPGTSMRTASSAECGHEREAQLTFVEVRRR